MRKNLFIIATLIIASVALAACGAPTTEAPVTKVPATEAPAGQAPSAKATSAESPMEEELLPIVLPHAMLPADVTGDIITAGSSTVFPLSERMAELFQNEGYEGNITVDNIGSGGGFERFCTTGETDIANASRGIKSSEVEACAAIGRTPLEFRVGTDALTVVLSTQNEFATSLTIEQLGQIFSGQAKTWNEVDPSFPAEAIKVYSPGADSGTFDYFIEAVAAKALPKKDDKDDLEGAETALLGLEGAQFSENDNVLVQGVAGDPYAIGYFGYAYYNENKDTLKAVSVNDIEPSQANVDAGTYPIARPLFMYSDAKIMQEKPQVAAFLAFYLANVNDNILDVGYFPAPAKALYSSWGAWLSTQEVSVDPSLVEGDIITAGSSTVFPLSERMAELFQNEGYEGNITVDNIGSGGGFERFCTTGETDIANASRGIKSSEVEACAAIGRTPLEFRVGTDALTVVLSTQNEFATSLTIEQLGQIFSGQAKTWNEVDPSFPAEAIKVYSPGADSGTFDFFTEFVVSKVFKNADGKDDLEAAEAALLGLEGAQFSEDDNVLVQGVASDPYAIGYFGYAYYNENKDTLKAVSVNDVEPSQANVDAGTYPLSRPLFMYSDAKIMQEKPQVAACLAFYLANVNDNILDVGYFPAPAKAIYQSWGAWYAAVSQ
ncbi:MAG: PstS family phosphate ABC transporter substrate-binding protein [Anaerolineales bacterium]|jgi:phosphate binding protein|nr:PstS family phosphate ABC transporter substrate-binding protein [Anaerolineales bacterium]